MGDTFTSEVNTNDHQKVAGMDFHHGAMDFSVQYSVPNKQDSMLKHDTSYNSIQIARRGKFAITGESVETIDVPHSVVAADWETRNNKAITTKPSHIALSVDIAAAFDLLGKVVSDLQKDTSVSVNSIVGTLKYVTDYTGFSSDSELQEGNYLAIKAVNSIGADRVTVQFAGRSEVTLDPDLTHVQRFPSAIPYVTVRAYDGTGKAIDSKTYDLSQLKFEAKA